MNDKLKHEQRIGRKTFFFAWVVIYVILGFSYQFLMGMFVRTFPLEILMSGWGFLNLVVGFLTHSGAGYLQQIAIRRYWGVNIQRWWWVTGVGSALASGLLNILPSLSFIFILMSGVITTTIVFSLQVLLLRHYFHKVWLYVLVAIASSLLASIIQSASSNNTNLSLLIFSAGTGLALLWLERIPDEQIEPDDRLTSDSLT